MTTVHGIDASLTGFVHGVGTMTPGGSVTVALHHVPAVAAPRTLQERVTRYETMAAAVVDLVRASPPDLVLLEGYSFGSKGAGVSALYELGVLVRQALLRAAGAGRVVEVPPSTLKRFACGKGNANKTAVASALAARYQQTFETDDEADAYALVRLGLVTTNAATAPTAWQREAADDVRQVWAVERGEAPATKKPRKKGR